MEPKSDTIRKLIKLEEMNPNEDSINSSNSDINNGISGQYSRQSFDRFGDDLCELLLSYLNFKDKIVFENVSHQWKRCVYNRQRVLRVFSVQPIEAIPHLNNVYLNDLLVPIVVKNFVSGYANNMNMKTINKTALKSLLIKCRFIKKIELTRCYIDSNILEVIANHCPHLESIQIDLIGLEEEDLINFGLKCGKRLKYVKFNIRTFFNRDYVNKFCNEFGKKLLLYCTNIKSFNCEDISTIFDKNVNFLPKLESVDLRLRRNDGSNLVAFVDKYELKMKKFKAYSHELDIYNLRNTLQQIARFRNIEDLNISFSLLNPNNNTINDKVIELSKNCPKLKRFVFQINTAFQGNEIFTGNIFDLFGNFVNLKHLFISFQLSEVKETVESFKRLTQLTSLSIKCSKVGDSFFKDIDVFLPKLRYFSVTTDYDLTDVIMDSISKLTKLEKLSLGSPLKALKFITDSGISKLIDSCKRLRTLSFLSRPNITTVTIDNLISLANKRSKSMISFYCGFSRLGDEATFASIDMNSYENLPKNLKITIRTGHQNPGNNNPLGLPELAPNVHVIEFNLNAAHNPPPINFQELHQLLLQQQGLVQNILNNI